MRDAIVVPLNNSTIKAVAKNWHVISALVMCAVSLGIAKGKYSGVQERVDQLELTKPEATAALTQRNSEELAAVRVRIDRIGDDVSATRVDVGRISEALRLQPIRAIDNPDGLTGIGR